MSMAGVLPDLPPFTAALIWKSWITHRTRRPSLVLREAVFNHMLPTPATLFAQSVLRGLQDVAGSGLPAATRSRTTRRKPRSLRHCRWRSGWQAHRRGRARSRTG